MASSLSDSNSGFLAGNVFSTPTGGIVSSILFDGTYNSTPASEDFTISLYSLTGGAPSASTLIASSTLSNVFKTASGTFTNNYAITGTLDTPLTLVTGTSYFLGIQDTTNPNESFRLVQSNSGPATTFYESFNNGGTFFLQSTPTSFAFTLSGTAAAPEPTTWSLLLVAGLLGIDYRVRLRRGI